MAIDTKIEGRPESIESASSWIRDSLVPSVTEAVSAIYTARNTADAGWHGQASEAFRQKLTGAGHRGDEFTNAATAMAQKFDDVAADLGRAQREMGRIRSQAATAGLEVAGYTITDPGPAPSAAGPEPTGEAATPAALDAYASAVDAQEAHARKVEAYDKARTDVDDVRMRWTTSVEQLNKESNSATAQGWFSVGDIANATAAAAATQPHSAILMKQSRALLDDASQAMRHVATMHYDYTGVVTDPKGMYQNLDRAQVSTRAAATMADDAAAMYKAGERFAFKAGGVLAVAGVAYEVSQGKDPVEATVSGAASFAASVGMGAAVGSMIPVPVAGTVAGAIVGAGVGVFTSGMVDSLFENGLDNIGGAIEDGGEAVVDAGEAVAGGVKDAWDAVF